MSLRLFHLAERHQHVAPAFSFGGGVIVPAMRFVTATILGLLLFVSAPGAEAQKSDVGTSEGRGWSGYYGWQLVLADAAAAGLALAPLEGNARGAALAVGMTGLFFNGPVVHMANANPKAASWSLLRLPVFLMGRLAGWGVGHLLCKDTGCRDPIEDWSGYVALGSMAVFDWATAWRPERSPWAARPEPRTVARAPRTGPAPPRAGPLALTFPLLVGAF